MIAPRAPRVIDLRDDDATDDRRRLAADLLREAACIAPKYFYDPLGASLFEAITRLPEYYLTRVEAAIVATRGADIAACIRADLGASAAITLVDLGAGNCDKAPAWIDALHARRYAAVDIAIDGLAMALERLQRQFAAVELLGIGCDFSAQLRLPDALGGGPRVMLYPGSSIGNFAPAAAVRFLAQVRAACPGGGLLIGVDLRKAPAVTTAAYNDALGVTAAFNRNVLLHVNRLLAADFDLRDWAHEAFFDPAQSRIEMHLRALRDCAVHWRGGARRFAAGARIHTENSYKWDADEFAQLLVQAGWRAPRRWTDADRYFAIYWARA